MFGEKYLETIKQWFICKYFEEVDLFEDVVSL